MKDQYKKINYILNTNIKPSKNEIKKIILFTIASKIKIFSDKLTKEIQACTLKLQNNIQRNWGKPKNNGESCS